MLRPRIQQLYRLPISHPAPARLCTPLLRQRASSSLRLSTPVRLRLLSTSPRRFSEPPKATPTPPQQPPLPETSAAPPPEPEPQQPKPPRRRRRRGVLYAAAFLLLGTTLGSIFRVTIAPPLLPTPGSAEDRELLAVIHRKAARLPLIQQLSSDPAWASWDAYSSMQDVDVDVNDVAPASASSASSDDNNNNNNNSSRSRRQGKEHRLTSGAMAGSRGLAFQRVFHCVATGECVTVVYFGGGTAGWPGVVHGGALATILDESLGRCAILQFPARTGVTAHLELNYKAPTSAEAFYVVRARPVVSKDDGGEKKKVVKNDRKLWVEGAVERLDGTVLVAAKALFVVPKGVKLAPLATGF